MENSSNISIKPISELLKCNFFIPSYQRGYRWTEQQVTDLLNDINEFTPKEIPNTNEKTWYCLQPIVVKQKGENEWDVIDGQQRLTTIFLVIHYMNEMWKGKQKNNAFNLRFETRDKSQEFLKNIMIDENSDEVLLNEENIDFHFISKAYSTIHNWVKYKDKLDTGNFESKFIHSSKIIWYETSTNEDPIDIFTRINSGKIPLTNAELIKALFLNSSNFVNADNEKLRLKQLEIASEWDKIEYALQDDSFWYFINKSENNLATRIEFIFNLMYDTSNKEFGNDEYSTFRFFNDKFKENSKYEVENNWNEIKKYFQTLEEWFNERELYHKIGYLITIGKDIKAILNEKKEKSKTEFANWINQQIDSKFENLKLEEVKYNGGYVREILLLHNIQTMLNNKNETNRFPFDRYKKDFWDVEHIHAIATEVKVKKENQVEWLTNNFIKTEHHNKEDFNSRIDSIISGNTIDENDFEDIISYVLGEVDKESDSLQNLCLLDRQTNRSYKNDSFKVKRRKIIEREIKGTFIPICTRNVFMKYYSTTVKDLEIWNESDRDSYFNNIQDVIKSIKLKTTSIENEQ